MWPIGSRHYFPHGGEVIEPLRCRMGAVVQSGGVLDGQNSLLVSKPPQGSLIVGLQNSIHPGLRVFREPIGRLRLRSTLTGLRHTTLGPVVVSDEIYHGLVYEGREHSLLEYTDNCFVLNGFSKRYAMTGWRLGYVIAPPGFVRPMQKLQQNFFISAPAPAQWAGVEALGSAKAAAEVERMVRTYDRRRRYLIERLKNMGFGLAVEPTGAFYLLVNARRFGQDSYRLAFDILEHARVGVTPGVDFGDNAEGYLRFTYANSLENIAEGMDRLERYLHRRLDRS